jgi:hypothetical protein
LKTKSLLSIEDKSASIVLPTVVPPALAQERVGQNEEQGPRNKGHKVRFELNPGGRTTDRKKSRARTTTNEKKIAVTGRSYADVARKAARKVGVVSKSVAQRVLVTL